MKKLWAFLLLSGIHSLLFAQVKPAPVCCSMDASDLFARNGSDKDFAASHDEPLPFRYVSDKGKDIRFKVADGQEARGWEVKSAKKTNNYIFVIHEWWGLNDYIKQETEKLSADLGVHAIALDLYDGKVAGNREEAAKYMQAASKDRIEQIIKGAVAYAGPRARIFTIGWCFGGGWSLQTTMLAGSQAAGCIMYYGQPEKDVEKLKTLNVDVLGIFGNRDQWPSPQVVDEFESNMLKANKKLILKRYDATHAFANPSNPNFDKAATEDAYGNVKTFIRERIK